MKSRCGRARPGVLSAALGALAAGAAGVGGCAPLDQSPRGAPERSPIALREIFPHVRFDKGAGIVEFDAAVACDCHQPTTPRVYLEQVACTPGTREYESLVVTPALPSHVHAALLLAGLEPGEPGDVGGGRAGRAARAPSGRAVTVTFLWRDESGRERSAGPLDWVIDLSTGEHLRAPDGGAWLFSGSRIVPYAGAERYEADLTGTLIGLTTFGSEAIAFARVLSPEAAVQEPAWVADTERVPRVGTPVVVRLGALD